MEELKDSRGNQIASRKCSNRRTVDGYWALVSAGEPFRLLFPLGTAIGIFGVLLWPLYVWHVTSVYPGPFHARIMIEGFLTCFVVGFLGTALPRLLGTPRLTIQETLGFAAALIGTTWLHYIGQTLWGDLLFFCMMAMFVFSIVVRFFCRRDTPPPAFVLVAMGVLCALIGASTQAVSHVSTTALPMWAVLFGRQLLYQGYLLLPIMGIGAFLLPRFFDLSNRQDFPESLTLSPSWKSRALFASVCGFAVLGSFVLEIHGQLQVAYALRAGAILFYFFREVPLHRAGFVGGSLAFGLRISLLSIFGGYVLIAFWPERTISFLHIVFISGFSLLTFIVASRVVLGHSGQANKFHTFIWPVVILSVFIVFAMLTRVSADWMPSIRMNHYAYAAIAWIIGAIIWGLFILLNVKKTDAKI